MQYTLLVLIEATLIVVVTKKGHMARLIAKFRPNVPVRISFSFVSVRKIDAQALILFAC